MRVLLLCNTTLSLSPPSPKPQKTPKSPNYSTFKCNSINWAEKALIGALGGALSFGLLFSSPSPSIAIESLSSSSSLQYCREDEGDEPAELGSAPAVTSEGIVEEAWKIVNDSFLETGRSRSFSETWQRKMEDIRSSSIKTRSKAHDTIKRMLASLGDPYTRFLSPEEFSKMARYDMSGIGINLREVQDDNGDVKLKVLGLVLDAPAYSTGVRQGDEVLAVNGLEVKGKSAFEVSSLMQGPNETFVTIKNKKFLTLRSSMAIVGLFNLFKSKDKLLLEPLCFIGWNK